MVEDVVNNECSARADGGPHRSETGDQDQMKPKADKHSHKIDRHSITQLAIDAKCVSIESQSSIEVIANRQQRHDQSGICVPLSKEQDSEWFSECKCKQE